MADNTRCDYATFGRLAKRCHVRANAEPGLFIAFQRFGDRAARRIRKVEVEHDRRRFTIDAPHDLTRELRTADSSASPEFERTLARCFQRAFFATLSRRDFDALRLATMSGSYEKHVRKMESDGSTKLARDLQTELGADLYSKLLEAIRLDSGCTAEEEAASSEPVSRSDRSVPAALFAQPLVLFPS